jgi:hypothetical protein
MFGFWFGMVIADRQYNGFIDFKHDILYRFRGGCILTNSGFYYFGKSFYSERKQ